jgi:hypothetical protein
VIGDKSPVVFFSVDDLLPHFLYAGRTERICRTRPSQRWFGFLPGF